MIYQGYYAPNQRAKLFSRSCYTGLGMTVALTPDLADYVPELADPAIQSHACEFGGLLYLARKGPAKMGDIHDFVGHTSWRQTDKGCHFVFRDTAQVEERMKRAPDKVLSWRLITNGNNRTNGEPLLVHQQAEEWHRGFNCYMIRMADSCPASISRADLYHYFTATQWVYCSYFCTTWPLLVEYTTWVTAELWPSFLANRRTDPYLLGHPRAWSFFQERLFSLWLHRTGRQATQAQVQ